MIEFSETIVKSYDLDKLISRVEHLEKMLMGQGLFLFLIIVTFILFVASFVCLIYVDRHYSRIKNFMGK